MNSLSTAATKSGLLSQVLTAPYSPNTRKRETKGLGQAGRDLASMPLFAGCRRARACSTPFSTLDDAFGPNRPELRPCPIYFSYLEIPVNTKSVKLAKRRGILAFVAFASLKFKSNIFSAKRVEQATPKNVFPVFLCSIVKSALEYQRRSFWFCRARPWSMPAVWPRRPDQGQASTGNRRPNSRLVRRGLFVDSGAHSGFGGNELVGQFWKAKRAENLLIPKATR